MANISRHEAKQLLEKFKVKYIPTNLSPGMTHQYTKGVRKVAREVTEGTGPSTPKLRSYARVLKHFLEGSRGEDAILYFNHIIDRVDEGFEATHAIKRCRSELDLAKAKQEMEMCAKKFDQAELEERLTGHGQGHTRTSNWTAPEVRATA